MEYQYNADKEVAEKAAHILKCEYTLTKYFDKIGENIRECIGKASDTHTILLISADESPVIQTVEELIELYMDSLQPCLETIVICDIPTSDLNGWLRDNFKSREPEELPENSGLAKLQKKSEKAFGTDLGILTFDKNDSTLFLPVGEGKFIKYSGEGYGTMDNQDDP